MERAWAFYHPERDEFLVADEYYMASLRCFDEESTSTDPGYPDQVVWLEEQGYREATLDDIADHYRVYDDDATYSYFCQLANGENLEPVVTRGPNHLASIAASIRQIAEVVRSSKDSVRVDSPYYDVDDAATYLRTTSKGIYSRIERGRLERCPGVRGLLFTKQMLDDSVMGRTKPKKIGNRSRRAT